MRFDALAIASAAIACVSLLAGCADVNSAEEDWLHSTKVPITPSDQRPSSEGVALGRQHFARGDYGLAERHFRAAVEANPESGAAWLGLAASYDRLRRFDLAERAYRRVIALEGRTPIVLNNLGYHHLLRGNLTEARANLLAAAAKDPRDPHIQGNLRLLETWRTGDQVAAQRDHRP